MGGGFHVLIHDQGSGACQDGSQEKPTKYPGVRDYGTPGLPTNSTCVNVHTVTGTGFLPDFLTMHLEGTLPEIQIELVGPFPNKMQVSGCSGCSHKKHTAGILYFDLQGIFPVITV